jgi:hypothetical protein
MPAWWFHPPTNRRKLLRKGNFASSCPLVTKNYFYVRSLIRFNTNLFGKREQERMRSIVNLVLLASPNNKNEL